MSSYGFNLLPFMICIQNLEFINIDVIFILLNDLSFLSVNIKNKAVFFILVNRQIERKSGCFVFHVN